MCSSLKHLQIPSYTLPESGLFFDPRFDPKSDAPERKHHVLHRSLEKLTVQFSEAPTFVRDGLEHCFKLVTTLFPNLQYIVAAYAMDTVFPRNSEPDDEYFEIARSMGIEFRLQHQSTHLKRSELWDVKTNPRGNPAGNQLEASRNKSSAGRLHQAWRHLKQPSATHTISLRSRSIVYRQVSDSTPLLDYLSTLPEKLLSIIINHVSELPKHRRKDLLALTLTNKLLGRLAFDALLTQPVVHIYNVHRLVRLCFKQPHVAHRVTTLEILTHIRQGLQSPNNPEFHDRSAPSTFAPTLSQESPLERRCLKLIEDTPVPTASKAQWIHDLHHNHQAAFMCILLVLLPNLRTLYLGTCGVCYFPFLKGMFYPDWDPRYRRADEQMLAEFGFPSWDHPYPSEVFDFIAPRLQDLELPVAWADTLSYTPPSLSRMSVFSSLRHLRVSHDALSEANLFYWRDGSISRSGVYNGMAILPESLETLTVDMAKLYAWRGACQEVFLGCLLKTERPCKNLTTVTLVYDFDICEPLRDEYMRRYENIIKQGKLLGLDIIIIHRPAWRLHTALQDENSPLYKVYELDSIPSATDTMVYESRGNLPELTRLRERADFEEAELMRLHTGETRPLKEKGRLRNHYGVRSKKKKGKIANRQT
jgi:hypothetical protein